MGGFGNFLLISTLSLLPPALWLSYFAGHSRYKRPSRRVIIVTFLLGAAATLPALALNVAGQKLWIAVFGRGDWTHLAILIFLVAPIEELLKLLVVYAYPYRQPEFDEPLDGVIYSAAVALGFAAVENAVYLAETGPLLVLLRGPLTNPGHALFSAFWGLSLSRAKGAPNLVSARLPLILQGWLLAVLLHGAFDLLLIAATRIHWIFLVILAGAVLALFFWVRARIRFYRDTSPHREGTVLIRAIVSCQKCGARGESGGACRQCGQAMPVSSETENCLVCRTEQEAGREFCVQCGASMRLTASGAVETRPHFVALTPAGEEHIAYVLNQGEIAVGRTLNNEFVISDPSVSKRHARITAEAADYALQDLGSINGTFVNGRRIERAMLEDGCEVRFGRASFVYREGRRGGNDVRPGSRVPG